jgi:hypothetical protein
MTAIQWISKEAKAIRKKQPALAWSQCIKKASVLYKAKHKTGSKPKKVGATKYVEKGETKNTKAKKVYQINRTKTGTFKNVKRIAGTSTHKDTRSHNVNVRVISGTDNTERLKHSIKIKENLENMYRTYKTITPKLRSQHDKIMLKVLPRYIAQEKKIIAELKKNIK